MSVETYPSLESLDEKLASLEDPALAERIAIQHPALFPTAADQEEISVFASAWRRFGNVALAVTAAASIVAGYLLAPFVLSGPSPAALPARKAAAVPAPPRHVPAPVHRAITIAAPHHPDAALRAALRKDEAEIVQLRARIAAAQPMPVRAPAAAHRVAVARAHAVPQPQSRAETAAAPETSGSTQVDASTSTSTSTATAPAPAPVPDAQAPVPDGTKNPPQPPPSAGRGGVWGEHFPTGIGGVILGRTIDPCTPQGGRIGTVLQSIAGQVLSRAVSRGF